MDPDKNPYAPGAGTQTPELAGRNELRETVRIALERVRAGRSTKSVLLVGLRGVGKTVLLDRLRGRRHVFWRDGRVGPVCPWAHVWDGSKTRATTSWASLHMWFLPNGFWHPHRA
ncbi:MAG: ATP-binding protein [Elusimicrobia bacterium]|nr:ATP-binding protein [Elusimicrobiota bacterium]